MPVSSKTKSAKTSSFKHKRNNPSKLKGTIGLMKNQQNLKKGYGEEIKGNGRQGHYMSKIHEYVCQDDQVMEETLQKLLKNKNISIKKDEIDKAKINFYPELEKTWSCSDRSEMEILDKKALEALYLKKLLLKKAPTIDENEFQEDTSKAKANITPRLTHNLSNKENSTVAFSKSGRLKQTIFQRIDLNSAKDMKLVKKKQASEYYRESGKGSKNYNLSQMRSPN
mmetsp:Transcript_1802/g.1724  ORF Transcript_1802/g.1724 Transcript_1802/m.1724 type:complete len:225 (-) Transcript_1802:2268-2942(-)